MPTYEYSRALKSLTNEGSTATKTTSTANAKKPIIRCVRGFIRA